VGGKVEGNLHSVDHNYFINPSNEKIYIHILIHFHTGGRCLSVVCCVIFDLIYLNHLKVLKKKKLLVILYLYIDVKVYLYIL
jgi:hypothetical protein